MKRSSQANQVGLANQRLVSTLKKNLANMEQMDKRNAVSCFMAFPSSAGVSLAFPFSFCL